MYHLLIATRVSGLINGDATAKLSALWAETEINSITETLCFNAFLGRLFRQGV